MDEEHGPPKAQRNNIRLVRFDRRRRCAGHRCKNSLVAREREATDEFWHLLFANATTGISISYEWDGYLPAYVYPGRITGHRFTVRQRRAAAPSPTWRPYTV